MFFICEICGNSVNGSAHKNAHFTYNWRFERGIYFFRRSTLLLSGSSCFESHKRLSLPEVLSLTWMGFGISPFSISLWIVRWLQPKKLAAPLMECMIIAFLLAWIKSYRGANSYACAIIADSSAETACRVAAALAFCREATASRLLDDYQGWTVKANFAGLTTRWLANLSGINLVCGISQMLCIHPQHFPSAFLPDLKEGRGKV